MAAALATEYPTTNDGWSAIAQPLSDEFIPDDVRLVLLTMMGAVTIVLLIACANVANLMLARASGRQREFCVRAALGAGRAQLIKQLLTECVVARSRFGAARAWRSPTSASGCSIKPCRPAWCRTTFIGRSARAASPTRSAISALTGLVFGLAPALQAGRLNLQEALRDGARGSGQSGKRARLRNGLVVARSRDGAHPARRRVAVRPQLPQPAERESGLRHRAAADRALLHDRRGATRPTSRRRSASRTSMRRIEALPGVTSAFASNFVPLDAGGGSGHAIVDGRAVPKGEEPTDSLHRGHAASLQDDGTAAAEGP